MSNRSRPLSQIIGIVLAVLASSSVNASVVLTGTRHVVTEARGEVSVNLTSNNDIPVLVQAWIDEGDPTAGPDDVQVPFLLTPPLFRMDPDQQQAMRIIALENDLPDDRESVFYLNVYEIPPAPTSPEYEGRNVLQFAIRSRVKLFYRPIGLDGNPNTAVEKLQWARSSGGMALIVENPTPFHVTLATIRTNWDGTVLAAKQPIMISPFDKAEVSLELSSALEEVGAGANDPAGDRDNPIGLGSVEVTFVDDFGAYRPSNQQLEP